MQMECASCEKMMFKGFFTIFRTICANLVEGIMGDISVKLF